MREKGEEKERKGKRKYEREKGKEILKERERGGESMRK